MLVIILIISIFITRHLFIAGFFPIHDSTHIARLFLMQKAIHLGNLPPLWADKVNQGYGYPLFHFYSPLAYYFSLLLKLFLPSFLLSIKMSFVTAFFLAGLGMYQFTKQWGSKVGTLASSIFLLTPYLALDLYVRGALAELWSIALLPWLFWSWQTLSQQKSSILKTALITSLFVLSHNLIPLITFPFLIIWIFIHQRQRIKSIYQSSLLSLGFSAFYILPLIFERGFVQVSKIAKTTNYSLHYVKLWQLWNSTWGFGGSAPGVADGISFKLGKLHIILALFSLLLMKLKPKLRSYIIFFSISTLTAVFLTTSYSSFIWDNLGILQMVQFPWRFLGLIAFFLATLGGLSILLFKTPLLKFSYLVVVVLTLLNLNLKYFQPQSRLKITDATYLNNQFITTTLAEIIPEYLPTWMPNFPKQPAEDLPQTLVGPKTYTLPRAYYPTWQATLFNAQTKQPAKLYPSSLGLIKLDVPQGSYQLKLIQTHTLLQKLSLYFTISAILIAIKVFVL